jgi:hypothetical protein
MQKALIFTWHNAKRTNRGEMMMTKHDFFVAI